MSRSKHRKSNPTKKALRRVDVEIVRRIVMLLHEHGKERKTKTALKANLAYDKCLRYLDWLESMGFVKRENTHDGSEFVNLTKLGNDLYYQYANIENTMSNYEQKISNVETRIPNIEDF